MHIPLRFGSRLAMTLLLSFPPALAVPSPAVQQQIAAQLAAAPGGVRINATEVAYDGGRFVVSFQPRVTTGLTADCPSGWFCFYDEVNYGYPRGRLSDCGFQDLGDWGWRNRVESTYYNLTTGSVAYLDRANPSVVLFAVGTGLRGLAKVAYPNIADYVMRTC